MLALPHFEHFKADSIDDDGPAPVIPWPGILAIPG